MVKSKDFLGWHFGEASLSQNQGETFRLNSLVIKTKVFIIQRILMKWLTRARHLEMLKVQVRSRQTPCPMAFTCEGARQIGNTHKNELLTFRQYCMP